VNKGIPADGELGFRLNAYQVLLGLYKLPKLGAESFPDPDIVPEIATMWPVIERMTIPGSICDRSEFENQQEAALLAARDVVQYQIDVHNSRSDLLA
jgi:hypothetical protein